MPNRTGRSAECTRGVVEGVKTSSGADRCRHLAFGPGVERCRDGDRGSKEGQGGTGRRKASSTLRLCVSRDGGRLWADPVSACGSPTRDDMTCLLSEVSQLLGRVGGFGESVLCSS